MSTINESLKKLFLGLGGDSSKLADNKDVSDYIDDLESAIAGKAASAAEGIIDDTDKSTATTYSSDKIEGLIGDVIDDTASSESKTYSSSKIESLIPADELPTVSADDNGKVLAVVNGAWTLVTMTAAANLETGAVTFTFTPDAQS